MTHEQPQNAAVQPAIIAHEEPVFAGSDNQEEIAGRERNVGTPLAPVVIATEDELTNGDLSDTPFLSPITPGLPNMPGLFGH